MLGRGERPYDRLTVGRCSPSLRGAEARAGPSALLRDAERSRTALAPGPNAALWPKAAFGRRAARPYVFGCGSAALCYNFRFQNLN